MWNSKRQFYSQFLRRLRWPVIIVIGLGVAACRRDMQDQPRYEMYRESAFFADRAAVRPLPEHSVPRGYLREDPRFYTGRTKAGATAGGSTTAASVAAPAAAQGAASFEPGLVTAIPFPVTREVLDRGQHEYQTFCLACHGPTGEGDGIVVRRGYRTPTSYHVDRLRGAPIGHFFDVMTNGWGAMPRYDYLVTPRDRWAIAAYIRVLQLSRSAKLDDLPPAERQRLASQIQAQPAVSPPPAQMPNSMGGTSR